MLTGDPPGERHWQLAAHDDRCNICHRPLRGARFYYEDADEAPAPRRGWTLCGDCSDAVAAQLGGLAAGAPLRLRVALGVVAAERALPEAERVAVGRSSERRFNTALIATVWAAFIVHAAAFVAIVVVIAHHH